MKITDQINKELKTAYSKDQEPKYLIMSPTGYIALNDILNDDEDDPFLHESTMYRNLIISVTHKKNFPDFKIA